MTGFSIQIIICTEKGKLEAQSKLLVSSLREFGGKYRNLPIFSYAPRAGMDISEETQNFFSEYGVIHSKTKLNLKYHDYPLANKPLACAHHESQSSADTLIFLDSDVFFLNEPSQFSWLQDADVLLRPVDGKNIGAKSFNECNGDYWQRLYSLLGVEEYRFVVSTVTNHMLFEYYNSGHIVSRRTSGLYSRWLENFELIFDKGILPANGKEFFLEQSVFAATVTQMKLNVELLDVEYNFPIGLLEKMSNPEWKVDELSELVSLHYHQMFEKPFSRENLIDRLGYTAWSRIESWLRQYGVL